MKKFTIRNQNSINKKRTKNFISKITKKNLLFIILMKITILIILLSKLKLEIKLLIPPTMLFSYIVIKNYIKIIKENCELKKIASRYLDPKIKDSLVQNPQYLINKNYQKNISILFCDLRNYSLISEDLNSDKLLNLTNNFFTKMSEVIVSNEGTIDKFIGDEIMVFWNAPKAIENYKIKTVLTALEMRRKLQELNQTLNLELDFGIGINCGNAIIGNVGGLHKSSYTIIGPHVNLAARLQTLTKKYKVPILISEYSVSNTKKIFNLRKIDKIRVKGFKKAITIYEPFLKTDSKKTLLKEKYEKAFNFYQNREWRKANEILKNISYDGPSQLLLKRITDKSPQSGWSGIYDWNKSLSI